MSPLARWAWEDGVRWTERHMQIHNRVVPWEEAQPQDLKAPPEPSHPPWVPEVYGGSIHLLEDLHPWTSPSFLSPLCASSEWASY